MLEIFRGRWPTVMSSFLILTTNPSWRLCVSTFTTEHFSYTRVPNMWPALPKPATYAHHVNERFSPSMVSSIYKLTNCQYTTAKCWQVCFCWGLFLRPVRRPRVLRCPLNVTGWLVQATTLLEITIQLVNDNGHWFSYVLWQFEFNGASLWAISPWKMQSSSVTRHFVAPHPLPLYKRL